MMAHCGDSFSGKFVWNLILTDICPTWTDRRATRNKGADGVISSNFQVSEKQLPVLYGMSPVKQSKQGVLGCNCLRYTGREPVPHPWPCLCCHTLWYGNAKTVVSGYENDRSDARFQIDNKQVELDKISGWVA